MRIASVVILVLGAAMQTGCGDNAPRTVTEGVDIEAIRAYEADQARMNKHDFEAEEEASEEETEEPATK